MVPKKGRPRPRTGSKLSAKRLNAAMRAAKALELRAAGESFPSIASKLGFSGRQGAYEAVKAALEATLREPSDLLRRLDLERLDALWRLAFERANRGDLHAASVCLRILERRARLLGLDAPTKQELTGRDGEPLTAPVGLLIVPGVITEEAWELMAKQQQDELAEKERRLIQQ